MYLMLLNYILKMVKMVHFILCIFYHSKKKCDTRHNVDESCKHAKGREPVTEDHMHDSVKVPG